MIRNAVLPDDRAAIMAGAHDFARRMSGAELLPRDRATFEAAVERVLGLPGVAIYLADRGRIMGGIGILYAPYLWNPDLAWADELFFWCAEDAPAATALRLIRHAEAQMRARGVRGRSFAALPSSPESLEDVYRRMGLKPMQITWAGPV